MDLPFLVRVCCVTIVCTLIHAKQDGIRWFFFTLGKCLTARCEPRIEDTIYTPVPDGEYA